ncbi:MAG TPA: single-stranded DNA-binding protein [Puia sp.]|jgi:single-strand DNA-binding protein|nr:single-stranded DNA-binding protein [Puia sp.]
MKNNVVQLTGYVGDSPKIFISKDGIKRAVIRVATHDEIKNDLDKTIYGTIWHEVIAWDKTADMAERSFVKGSHIMVWGSLSYRKYVDKTGILREIAEIKANSLNNLDR